MFLFISLWLYIYWYDSVCFIIIEHACVVFHYELVCILVFVCVSACSVVSACFLVVQCLSSSNASAIRFCRQPRVCLCAKYAKSECGQLFEWTRVWISGFWTKQVFSVCVL